MTKTDVTICTIVAVCGCEENIHSELEKGTVPTTLELHISGQRKDRGMTKGLDEWPVLFTDIFVFDDDRIGRLDSYEHKELPSKDRQQIQSRSGGKRIVVIANCRLDSSIISGIYNYADIKSLAVEYHSDDPRHPFMSGEAVIDAGCEKNCIVEMEPMLSEIRIDGIEDRIGLKNPVMYLSGAGARAELMRREGFRPVEFTESEKTAFRKGAVLYCYPNNCKQESMGSPFTRLVIEGMVDGKYKEFSIPVNREGYGWKKGDEGISRNTLYLLDINLGSQSLASVKPSP